MQMSTTTSSRPLAWLIEYCEFERDDSKVKVAMVIFDAPTGHYIGCSTPIFDKAELNRLLEVQKAEKSRSLQVAAHDEEILSAQRYVTPMSSWYS